MGKQRNIYRAYTSAELKSRSSIPSAANITDMTTYIDCINISLAAVKNILGSTYSLYDICRHVNIKKWSAFSPKIISISGNGQNGEIVWNHPTSYSLGSFAGYNHNAAIPSYYNTNRTTTWSGPSGDTVTFECQFTLGELILTDLATTNGAIAFTIWNGATYVAHAVRSLSTLKDSCLAAQSREFIVNFTGPTGSGGYYVDYTCKLYLIDSGTYSYGVNELAKLFHVELPQYVKRVRIQTSSTTVYHNTPYTATFVTGGWEISTGHINTSALTLNHSYATGLKVDAWVEQYNVDTNVWTTISSVINMRDPSRNIPYTSGDPIVSSYSVHHWTYINGTERTPPVPDYDYRLYINYDGV